jgi:DNA-binding transcriptional ArsR family regulator
MDLQLAAQRLAELGHITRLAVFRHLVRCGPGGCRVGDVQQMLGIPASTLSHHIARLVSVGLVEQQREGRILHCLPKIDAFNETVGYLTEECCQGSCDVDTVGMSSTPATASGSSRGESA